MKIYKDEKFVNWLHTTLKHNLENLVGLAKDLPQKENYERAESFSVGITDIIIEKLKTMEEESENN